MRIHYPQTIRPTPKQLEEDERQLRGTALGSRARLLRLLQTGQARSLPEAACLLGYSTVPGTRWWACSRQCGLSGWLRFPAAARSSGAEDGRGAWRG